MGQRPGAPVGGDLFTLRVDDSKLVDETRSTPVVEGLDGDQIAPRIGEPMLQTRPADGPVLGEQTGFMNHGVVIERQPPEAVRVHPARFMAIQIEQHLGDRPLAAGREEDFEIELAARVHVEAVIVDLPTQRPADQSVDGHGIFQELPLRRAAGSGPALVLNDHRLPFRTHSERNGIGDAPRGNQAEKMAAEFGVGRNLDLHGDPVAQWDRPDRIGLISNLIDLFDPLHPAAERVAPGPDGVGSLECLSLDLNFRHRSPLPSHRMDVERPGFLGQSLLFGLQV